MLTLLCNINRVNVDPHIYLKDKMCSIVFWNQIPNLHIHVHEALYDESKTLKTLMVKTNLDCGQ